MHSICTQKSTRTILLLLWDAQETLKFGQIKDNKAVQEEDELVIANIGRQDAKKHLEEHFSNLMSSSIVQTLETLLDTVVF